MNTLAATRPYHKPHETARERYGRWRGDWRGAWLEMWRNAIYYVRASNAWPKIDPRNQQLDEESHNIA